MSEQKPGWRWVPVEPTREMLDAVNGVRPSVTVGREWVDEDNRATWAAMLDAAPQEPAAQPVAWLIVGIVNGMERRTVALHNAIADFRELWGDKTTSTPLYAAPPAPAQPVWQATQRPGAEWYQSMITSGMAAEDAAGGVLAAGGLVNAEGTPAPAQPDDAAAIVRQDHDCEAEWEREFKEVGTAAEWRRLLQQTRALTADARRAGRAEALAILLRTSADAIGDYIGSHAIGDTGDYGEHWLDDKLRALFDVDGDNPMESLLDALDNAYWTMVGRSMSAKDRGITADATAIVRQLVGAVSRAMEDQCDCGPRLKNADDHKEECFFFDIGIAIAAAQEWLEGK